MKAIRCIALSISAAALLTAQSAPRSLFSLWDAPAKGTVVVTVDPSVAVGPVKDVHGVNNGPALRKSGQNLGVFGKTFHDAQIPYARTHDAAFEDDYGGAHTIDISAIFPDFSADPNDPKNYDFKMTDRYLDGLQTAGTKVYYRLGQKIEHLQKKYNLRPTDFKKWAVVCEHLIRHVNEGWADGHHRDITHWEIWNEPDNNYADNPECWSGTDEEFFEFFVTAQRHLKSRFPHLKIGGPGLMDASVAWERKFFDYLKAKDIKLDLDFISWHGYNTDPRAIVEKAKTQRALFDAAGYTNTESHVTEWNYVTDFERGWEYSLRVERGDRNEKGAAYVAAMLTTMQDAPVDLATYYDARPCCMNGLYDEFRHPIRGYYPFYAWSKLKALGTQVKAAAVGLKPTDTASDVFVTAAKGPDGRLGILLVRYTNDDNVATPKVVRVTATGRSLDGATCHLTDRHCLYTERPAYESGNGTIQFLMEPNAFIFVEKGL